MKKTLLRGSWYVHQPNRTLPRLSMVMLLVISLHAFQLQAADTVPKGEVISLDFQNIPLKEVFKSIEERTNYRFFYSTKAVDESMRITILIKDATIDEVLASILKHTPDLSFKIKGDQIMLRKNRRRETRLTETEPLPTIYYTDKSQEPDQLAVQVAEANYEFTVQGVVTSETGEGMPGVNVVLKGTTNGTTTDVNGNYFLKLSDGSGTLTFSFIGYAAQEIPINNQTTINVSLQLDVRSLDEVVVVGYGEQKKINVTGAVATVNADFLSSRPITNASQAIQGVPGLFVNQTKGRPGADGTTIRIRGLGTLGNNDPLVLVDWVEYSLRDINPNDIESISVLKDAASSAIYGNRAANGVILIKTKKGNKGESKIEYNNYFGLQQVTQVPNVVTDAVTYMEGKNLALANEGRAAEYSPALLQEYRDGVAQSTTDPTLKYIYANTNWFDEMFRSAAIQEHNLRFAGGNEKTIHSISLSYLNQNGILLNTWAKRYSVNTNITTNLSEKLTLGINLMGTYWVDRESAYTTDEGNGEGGIMGLTYRGLPMQVPYTADGSYSDQWVRVPGHNFFRNPVALSYEGFKKNETLRAFTNLFLEFKLPFDITYKTTLAVNINSGEQKTHNPTIPLKHPKTGVLTPMGNIPARQVREENVKFLGLTNFHTLNWQKNFNTIHAVSLLAGFSAETFINKSSNASIQGFAGNQVTELNGGSSAPQVGGSSNESKLTSLFGRANYGLKDRYLFEASYRYDGSSRFQKGQRWGFFPSVSAGWRISEESFLVGSKTITNLKLRASWGKLGNQNIALFAYQDALFPGYNYSFNNLLSPGVASTQLTSTNLKWETTTMLDVGLDAGFFQNKLTLEFDYYDKLTEDILRQINVPEQVGNLQGPVRNIGAVSNKGLELSLTYRNEMGKFHYSIGANLGYVKNQVTKLNEEIIFGANTITQEGDPINSLYGLQADRLFKDANEVAQHAFQNISTKPGDIRYRDVFKDGIIDNRDRVVMGNLFPTFTYSVTGTLRYQAFDLSFLWQGVKDVDTYLTANLSQPYRNGAGVTKEWLTDSWTPENIEARLPRLTTSNGYPENFKPSSFWVQDASYLRLKNLQVGYSLPSSLLQKIKIAKLRVFANAQNLLTITDFKLGDPERNLGRADLIEYPNSRTITAGLSLTF
jgi:TonB-dependent starch-binding outer membrane protein SusC